MFENEVSTIEKYFYEYSQYLEKLHGEYAEKQNQIEDRAKYVRENSKDLIDRYEEQKRIIKRLYGLAKEKTSLQIEQVDGIPVKPDMNLLNEYALKINHDSLEDPYAKKVVELSAVYICYCDNEISKLSRGDAAFLSNPILQKELHDIEFKINELEGSAVSYINSPQMKQLGENMQREMVDVIDATDYSKFFLSSDLPRKTTVAWRVIPFNFVPKTFRSQLRSVFGDCYDDVQHGMRIPIEIPLTGGGMISYQYHPNQLSDVRDCISALILRLFRYYNNTPVKISLCDYCNLNSELLGAFSSLCGDNMPVDSVPGNEYDIDKEFARLKSEYEDIEKRKLGFKSVFEYNENAIDKIPYRLLIIHDLSDSLYMNGNNPDRRYLENNAGKLGISIICLSPLTENSVLPDTGMIQKNDLYRFKGEGNEAWKYCIGNECFKAKLNKIVGSVSYDFINRLSADMRPSAIGTRYFDRYKNFDVPKRQGNFHQPPEIAFAIDDNDQAEVIRFDNDNYYCFITGSMGCGKTKLILSMIAGLILNYHPEDVELWIADFKKMDFMEFADMKAPQVHYLLLEDAYSLVVDFVNNMLGELRRRQQVFSLNRWKDIMDVPAEIHMPYIFCIIDEFGRMSRILKDTGLYKDFEEMFMRGRAMGFRLIMSHQSYDEGAAGLTELDREMIPVRIAMDNNNHEKYATLELTGNNSDRNPQIEHWVESLPRYECVCRKYKDGRKEYKHLRCMYYGSEGYEIIERAVNNMKVYYKAVDESQKLILPEYYIDHDLIYMNEAIPVTLDMELYNAQERRSGIDNPDSDMIPVYPGVALLFDRTTGFEMKKDLAENILLFANEPNDMLAVIWAICECVKRIDTEIEIWTMKSSRVYRQGYQSFFQGIKSYVGPGEICKRMNELNDDDDDEKDRLVIVLSYDEYLEDLEDYLEDLDDEDDINDDIDPDEITDRILEINDDKEDEDDPEKIKEYEAEIEKLSKKLREYNEGCNRDRRVESITGKDAQKFFRRAPRQGCHFLFGFRNVGEFVSTKLDNGRICNHLITFFMNRQEAAEISLRDTGVDELGTHVGMYQSKDTRYEFRPFLYPDSDMYIGWRIGIDGKAEQIK